MRLLSTICLILLLNLLVACGDSTRNDQGTSFTFFGWFFDEGTTGATGLLVNVSTIGLGGTGSDDTLLFAGLQNNLSGQTIRVERIFHKYFIPGALVQPPETSDSLPTLLGPAAPGGSTLPDTVSAASDNYGQVFLITPQIREFIVLNRRHLPEPPFSMIVTSYATGVTSSGKRIETNEIQIDVLFSTDVEVEPPTPTGGFGGGAGGVNSPTVGNGNGTEEPTVNDPTVEEGDGETTEETEGESEEVV